MDISARSAPLTNGARATYKTRIGLVGFDVVNLWVLPSACESIEAVFHGINPRRFRGLAF